jgi:hypothetical protein
LEIIRQNIPRLESYLESAKPKFELDSQHGGTYLPLGQLRLRLVELVYLLLKLNKPQVYEMLAESGVFTKISDLLAQYPWNNFLQLKIVAVFEEVLENCDSAVHR